MGLCYYTNDSGLKIPFAKVCIFFNQIISMMSSTKTKDTSDTWYYLAGKRNDGKTYCESAT